MKSGNRKSKHAKSSKHNLSGEFERPGKAARSEKLTRGNGDDPENGWDALEREFQQLLAEIGNIKIPSQDELDAFKASLIAPRLVSSPLRSQISYGYLFATQAKGLTELVDAFRDVLAPGESKRAPEHIEAHRSPGVEEMATSLQNRALDIDLVRAWGETKQAYGIYLALTQLSDAADRDFMAGIKAAMKRDATLQRYWCAHWMKERGYPGKLKDPTFARDELAELCLEIASGKRKPMVYSVEWFAVMIKELKGDADNKELKQTYTSELTMTELKRMTANPLIPPAALPPLSADQFPLRGPKKAS